MSTRRTTKGGYVDPSRLPRGPNGRALCRRCSDEVPVGRRTFCSETCVHEWQIRTQPQYARQLVEQRDHGVCALCNLDTKELSKWLVYGVNTALNDRYRRDMGYGFLSALTLAVQKFPDSPIAVFAVELMLQGWPQRWFAGDTSSWQADHIVPVVEGGGECGLENLRTLCLPCHLKVTKELRQRMKSRAKTGTM